MPIKFEKHTGDPQAFFELLPQDWQEAVLPIWEKHSTTTSIFVLKEHNGIIAGGLVFSEFTTDMDFFKQEAKNQLKEGSLYIGYLFVIESRRGEDLGAKWLNDLKAYYPETRFWLTIEEEKLELFYTKNGFKVVKQKAISEQTEWLLEYKF